MKPIIDLMTLPATFSDVSLLLGIITGIIGLMAYVSASSKKEYAARIHFDKIIDRLTEIERRLISLEHGLITQQSLETETKFAIERLCYKLEVSDDSTSTIKP